MGFSSQGYSVLLRNLQPVNTKENNNRYETSNSLMKATCVVRQTAKGRRNGVELDLLDLSSWRRRAGVLVNHVVRSK